MACNERQQEINKYNSNKDEYYRLLDKVNHSGDSFNTSVDNAEDLEPYMKNHCYNKSFNPKAHKHLCSEDYNYSSPFCSEN